MAPKYRPYIPETLGDLMDKLTVVLLNSPTFVDMTGYFPEQNVETTFYALNAGLLNLRAELGEDLYRKLVKMSDQIRACFEADSADETGKSREGKKLVLVMEELVEARIVEIYGPRPPSDESRDEPLDIPESLDDLMFSLTAMLLSCPALVDKIGVFPKQNLETNFHAVNEGLVRLRPELGETLHRRLTEMSDWLKDRLEADPGEETGEASKGRHPVLEMENQILEMERLVAARIAESH